MNRSDFATPTSFALLSFSGLHRLLGDRFAPENRRLSVKS
jgi:hypothetical protein